MIHVVYGENCPYCSMAKQLLENEWIQYTGIDVTSDREKRIELSQIAGMMTIPMIFHWEIKKENLIGGYSELQQLQQEWKLTQFIS